MGLTEKPDHELVLAALRGDVDGFVTLCHRYYRPLVTIARAVVGDGHLAEDAAQEPLAKACRHLGDLQDPARFGAWLATICRRQAADLLRRRPGHESLGARDVAAAQPDPDAEVDALRAAIDQLPAASRELLYLRYRSDLSYEAIASLLDTTPEAVHGRLRRTKLELRRLLERPRAPRSP